MSQSWEQMVSWAYTWVSMELSQFWSEEVRFGGWGSNPVEMGSRHSKSLTARHSRGFLENKGMLQFSSAKCLRDSPLNCSWLCAAGLLGRTSRLVTWASQWPGTLSGRDCFMPSRYNCYGGRACIGSGGMHCKWCTEDSRVSAPWVHAAEGRENFSVWELEKLSKVGIVCKMVI